MTKQTIAYRFWSHETNHAFGETYTHLTLRIYLGQIYDAAADYDRCPNNDALERLREIRENSKTTRYFLEDMNKEIEITWQADPSNDCWYACKVDCLQFDGDSIKALQRIYHACKTHSPDEILAALRRLNAQPLLGYDRLYSRHLLADIYEPKLDYPYSLDDAEMVG